MFLLLPAAALAQGAQAPAPQTPSAPQEYKDMVRQKIMEAYDKDLRPKIEAENAKKAAAEQPAPNPEDELLKELNQPQF